MSYVFYVIKTEEEKICFFFNQKSTFLNINNSFKYQYVIIAFWIYLDYKTELKKNGFRFKRGYPLLRYLTKCF